MSTSNRRIASGWSAALALVLPVITVLLPVAGTTATAAATAGITCDPVAATQPSTEPTLLSFDSQTPERIVDTRVGTGGVSAPLGAGCTLRVDMSGIGPDDVAAFALSVTVISQERGFFTAFPCASGRPGTSSVNARAGVPTPNLVVAVPDASGAVCLYSERGGNVVVDVSGWWAEGPNRFTPVEPKRAYDSRVAPTSGVKLPAEAVQAVDVGGVIVPADAVSVTVSLAAVAPETSGFLVVYPCGQPRPLASNLNFVAGERRAVSAIVELGSIDAAAEGKVCVSGNATTHFLLDVTGYDAPSAFTSPDVTIEPVADTRIVDTRSATVPGVRFGARTTQRFDLSSVIDRPDDAVAVVLNAVAVRASSASFLSITPCVAGTPTTSSINYDLNQTANLVVTSLTADTEFCVYTDTAVDVVIDLVGVVTGPEGSLINQLSLSEIDGTLVPLDQEFAVDSPDATMRCATDRNLRLRLGVASGVTAEINGVPVPPRNAVLPDRPVTLTPDGLLTVSLTRGSETAEYFVRCLPADFPTFLVEKADGAAPGWYLTDLNARAATGADFLAILDERGTPVWYQRLDRALIDAKLLSTGDIVAAPNPPGFTTDSNFGHRVIGLDGELVEVRTTGDPALPANKHDYVEIPSLAPGASGPADAVISYPKVPNVDLTDLDLSNTTSQPNFRCPASVVQEDVAGSGTNERTIVDGTIYEQSAAGPWQWDASEHFALEESTFSLCFKNDATENGGAGEVDPFHINSLQRIEEPDCEPTCDYLISARHLDAVVRIDRGTRDPDGVGGLAAGTGYVEWILTSTDAPAAATPNILGDDRFDAPRLKILNDPLGGPLRMHDARLEGDLLTMHDNRTASDQPARFVEYRIDTSSADPDEWTATLTRQINAPFNITSGSVGSAQAAADGSVLMGWGALRPVFIEYAADGVTELLRINVPQAAPYRIVKYAPTDFDADELRATAGNTTESPSP